MNRSNEELYFELKEKMFEALESEEFYHVFNNSIRSGKNNFSLYQRYMNSVIDIKWVEKIEDSLIALDNIIRNPQRFIKETEEVIPIEQARKVSENSIKHLAQNTSYIAKIDQKGFITPSKILNVQKDETFETYENRFIYTLLIHLQYFIDKRLKALHDARVKSEYKLQMDNEFYIGNEKIEYQLSLTSTEKTEKRAKDLDLNADTSQMEAVQRVERLIQIMYDFQNSQLIKSLKGVTLVKPPIMRTNVILKNPNFKKALELWQYIETYYDAGVNIELVESEVVPTEEYIEDLFTSTLINYCLFNHHIKPAKRLASKSPALKKFKPNFVQHIVKDYLEDLRIDVDIVEKVFVDKIKRATAKRKELDKSIATALANAIEKETKNLEKQTLSDERRLKRAMKEMARRKKEEEERLRNLENERLKELAELEAKENEAIVAEVEPEVKEPEVVEETATIDAVTEEAPKVDETENKEDQAPEAIEENNEEQVLEVGEETNEVTQEEVIEDNTDETFEEETIEVLDEEDQFEEVSEELVDETPKKKQGKFRKLVKKIFQNENDANIEAMAERLEQERLASLNQTEVLTTSKEEQVILDNELLAKYKLRIKLLETLYKKEQLLKKRLEELRKEQEKLRLKYSKKHLSKRQLELKRKLRKKLLIYLFKKRELEKQLLNKN